VSAAENPAECAAHLQSRPWRLGRWEDVRTGNRHRSSATARDAAEARRIVAADPCSDHLPVLMQVLAILAADAGRKSGRRYDGRGTTIAAVFDIALDGAGMPPAKPLHRPPGTPPPIPDIAPADAAQAVARILTKTRHLRPEAVAAAVAGRIGISAGLRTSDDEHGIQDAVRPLISEVERMAQAIEAAGRKPPSPKRLARAWLATSREGLATSREGPHLSIRNPRFHFMAYGMWNAEDGREVAFNRQYRPILQRRPGGPVEAADGDEWVRWSRLRYFYNDGHPEQEKRRRSCAGLLAAGWPPESVPFERERRIPASRLPLPEGMK